MPMGGKGSRFSDRGIDCPKPMIKISGRPFFYWSTMSIAKFLNVADITFIVLREHIEKHGLDQEIYRWFPDAKIHVLPEVLNGAVLTCIEGLKEIDDDSPILINDCDHAFRCRAFEEFCKGTKQVDGALLTFKSDEEKYSFLRLDQSGNVQETVEKKAISTEAICGCYYFASKNLFFDAAQKYLEECQYKEFFISGVYNVMASWGNIIKAFRTDFHLPFGVPEEYEEAKDSPYFKELM